MKNMTGNTTNWAADLIEGDTQQGRIVSIQRPEGHLVRAKIGGKTHEMTSEKGQAFNMDTITDWVRTLPAQ
ncbi:hypothetical protein [Corynebacterium phocae]|nr:hypothetical protein [Corynebacterium phocae]